MSSETRKTRKRDIGKKRKEEILAFVEDYIAKNGFSPSIREICKAVGLSSTSSVHRYLNEMMASGQIKNKKNVPRTLMPEKNERQAQGDVVWVPVVDSVSNGVPDISSGNAKGYIGVPNHILDGKEMFGMRIGENDPFENRFDEGDIVFFCIPGDTATDGQTIPFDPPAAEIAGVFHPAKRKEA